MELEVIFSDDRDECLEHYGVKGMKWGKHLMRETNNADDGGWHKDPASKVASLDTFGLNFKNSASIVSSAAKDLKSTRKAYSVIRGKSIVNDILKRNRAYKRVVSSARANAKRASENSKKNKIVQRIRVTKGGKF